MHDQLQSSPRTDIGSMRCNRILRTDPGISEPAVQYQRTLGHLRANEMADLMVKAHQTGRNRSSKSISRRTVQSGPCMLHLQVRVKRGAAAASGKYLRHVTMFHSRKEASVGLCRNQRFQTTRIQTTKSRMPETA